MLAHLRKGASLLMLCQKLDGFRLGSASTNTCCWGRLAGNDGCLWRVRYPGLPTALGFPVACCLLAFSMACFLCSSVMEKPGGRTHVRPHLAFSCSCASLEGFLVQVLSSCAPFLSRLRQPGMAGTSLTCSAILSCQPRERTKLPEPLSHFCLCQSH